MQEGWEAVQTRRLAFYEAGYAPEKSLVQFLKEDAGDPDMDAILGEARCFVLQKLAGGCEVSVTDVLAIHIYTVECTVYKELNRCMREADPEAIARWRPMIFYLSSALERLPPLDEHAATVFRGISIPYTPEVYAPDKRVVWPSFSSTSSKRTVCHSFANQVSGLGLIFEIHGAARAGARSIAEYSVYPHEAEVLLPPNVEFVVSKVKFTDRRKEALGQTQYDNDAAVASREPMNIVMRVAGAPRR